jgi:radical SAM superfamily enzyme YgiQ (UPF0313 family)
MLNVLRKGTRVEQALKAASLCREHGILIFANYMMGIPTETEEDLEATYNLMKEINPEIHAANYFSPIPGSNLYEYCKDNDMINATSYDMFVRGAVDNKVKGVNYKLLGQFKERIERWSPAWYSEGYYASCILKRWTGLIRHGHILHTLKEFVTHTPFLNAPIRGIYQQVRGGQVH